MVESVEKDEKLKKNWEVGERLGQRVEKWGEAAKYDSRIIHA